MIEATVRNFLNEKLDVPAWLEMPKGETIPSAYVLIQKTGSSRYNHIDHATFAIQSYNDTMAKASLLNEAVKAAMDNLITLQNISASKLNSDYNFTDTQTKQYRYQAVYDITYKEE